LKQSFTARMSCWWQLLHSVTEKMLKLSSSMLAKLSLYCKPINSNKTKIKYIHSIINSGEYFNLTGLAFLSNGTNNGNLEWGYFSCLKLLTLGKCAWISYYMFTCKSEMYVSCNMKDFWRSQSVSCTLEGITISETVQDENFVITSAFCDGTLWCGIPAPLSHCTQILRKSIQGMWPHR